MEALRHLDPPDTDFAGPVVIWVIGRLDVAIVLFHISPADGFGDKGQGWGRGECWSECSELLFPSSSPTHIP